MTKAQTATAARSVETQPPFTLVRKDDPTFVPGTARLHDLPRPRRHCGE